MDGSAVLNLNAVHGKFVDFPNANYLDRIKNKKEKQYLYLRFMDLAQDALGLTVKLRNIYNIEGKMIFDLSDIPQEDKYCYVSTNKIFVGISIINYGEIMKFINSNENDKENNLNYSIDGYNRDYDNYNYNSNSNFYDEKDFSEKKNLLNTLNNFNNLKNKNLFDEDHKQNLNSNATNNEIEEHPNFFLTKYKQESEKLNHYTNEIHRKYSIFNIRNKNKKEKINKVNDNKNNFYENSENSSFDIGHFYSKNDENYSKNNLSNPLKEKNDNKSFENSKKKKRKNFNTENKDNISTFNIRKSEINKENLQKSEKSNFKISEKSKIFDVKKTQEKYFSDDEKNKKKSENFLDKNFNFDHFKISLHFLEFISEKNKIFLKSKIKKSLENQKSKKNKISKLVKIQEKLKRSASILNDLILEENEHLDNEEQKKAEIELINIVDDFNKVIGNKLNSLDQYMKEKKKKKIYSPDCPDKLTKKIKNDMVKRTKMFMKNFILSFELFTTNLKGDNSHYHIEKDKEKKFNKYVIKNKMQFDNIYKDIEKNCNKAIHSLFQLNIPKILQKYNNFSRIELYNLFVQYKVIMKISMAMTKDKNVTNKGIDFMSFYKGVHQMSNESSEVAMKMFNVVNNSKSNYLSIDEFLRGMSIIKSENLYDKIDMFFKIIDTDNNGELSWNEVYNICRMSLRRTLVVEDDKTQALINELSEYFADLIFEYVEVDKNEEIPLPKIKEVCLFYFFYFF